MERADIDENRDSSDTDFKQIARLAKLQLEENENNHFLCNCFSLYALSRILVFL